MRPRLRLAGAAMVAMAVAAPAAWAGDAQLVSALRGEYPAAERASAAIGGPQGTQSAYDRARDLQEALRRSAPVGAACRPLAGALAAYAAGRVLQTEGIDRPSPGDVATGRARAERARGTVAATRSRCAGARGGARRPGAPVSPARGEAFFGTIVARAPAGADRATISSPRGGSVSVAVSRGRVRASVDWPLGPHDITIRFTRAGRPAGGLKVQRAQLLPASATRTRPAATADPSLSRALAGALAGGPRYRAAWVQSLSSGRVGHVNAAARFPAASTVKLALAAAVIARLGGAPLESPYAYDLRAMLEWSSNLANNRLARRFGSSAAADGFRRLGTRSSTFTGEYIVGTEIQPALPSGDAANQPPGVSARVTTASDLARMLFSIHASMVSRNARGHTGLTAHQARLLMGWMLASQQRGDNAGLFAGGLPRGARVAQKNGWINDARLGAAVVYGARGPVIVVLATYDDAGVGLARGRALGARVGRVAAAVD